MNAYKLQNTTIRNFPDGESWATHEGDYRGSWSPYVPKGLILRYTEQKDLVLDCFVGSETTLIEAKLLNRNAIGVDINKEALKITRNQLNFDYGSNAHIQLHLGNAQNLKMVEDNSIGFICAHPPYADITKYSKNIENDISNLEYDEFLAHMNQVSKEPYHVLKPSHFRSFMIGDIRKKGNVIPLGFLTMQTFINNGFTLKEIIIKE